LLHHRKALNGLICADVPLRNYSLTHSLTIPLTSLNIHFRELKNTFRHVQLCGRSVSVAVLECWMLFLISPVTDMGVGWIQDSGLPCDSLSPQPQSCYFVLYTMGHKNVVV